MSDIDIADYGILGFCVMITGYMAWCIVQDNKSPARSFASRGFDPTVGTAGYVKQIEDGVQSWRNVTEPGLMKHWRGRSKSEIYNAEHENEEEG
jgi:hypothetical protein